jgi:hypothetical protein
MLTQHSVVQVKDALGITRNMLRDWRNDDGDHACVDTAFVAIPVSQPDKPATPASITFTLTLSRARQISLAGDFSPEQLTALMRGVVAGMEQA